MALKEELACMDFEEFEQSFSNHIDEAILRCDNCDCSNCETCEQDCKQCPCDSCELSILKDFKVLDTIVKKHFG